MASIVSKPASIVFTGNCPNAVITSAASEVAVSIKQNGVEILSDIFNPASGQFTIKLKEIIDPLLSVVVPASGSDVTEQTGSIATFTVSITDTETISFTFIAIHGGVDADVDAAVFLAANWLTWQPQSKYIKYYQPEFLTYYTQQAVNVKVKGYFADGTNTTVTFAALAANKMFTLDCSYPRLKNKFTGSPSFFDVWVEDASGNRLNYVQRLILTDTYNEFEDLFVIENSLGGIDTVRFTGEKQEANEIEYASAVFDETSIDYDIDYTKKFTKYTGYFGSENERRWALELFHALQRYHVSDGALKAIVVTEPKLESIKNELNGYEFIFAYALQTKYLNLTRTETLPDVIEIVDPAGDVFFLPPRLIEFSWADTALNPVIPVQYPNDTTWRILSFNQIKEQFTADKIGAAPAKHTHTLNDLIGDLSNLSINLANYYTKTQSDAAYSKLGHTHTISEITDKPYSIVNGTVIFSMPLASVGNISAYSAIGNNASIFDALASHVDGQTIGYSGGLLYLKSGSTFSGSWNNLTDKPTTVAGYGITDAFTKTETEARYKPIGWTPDLSVYQPALTAITTGNISSQSVNYATIAGSAPASDVYAWAKAATKPSYSYGEISGTPDLSVYQSAASAWNTGNFNPATKADVNGNYSNIFNVNSLGITNSNLALQHGTNTSLRISTAYGYVDVGAQNGAWSHFETDRPNFYFGTSVYVNGRVHDYITQQPYWHKGDFDIANYQTTSLIKENYVSSGTGGSITDFNNLISNSFIGSIDANTNTPFGNAWYTLYSARHRNGLSDGSDWGSQIAIGMTGSYNRLAFRTQYAGTWQNWNEIYHTGNFNPSSKADVNGSYSNDFNAKTINLEPGDGNGVRFWGDAGHYSIYMASSSANGDITGDSADDYNLYYKCRDNNRGHAFITGNNAITTQINSSGVFTKGWFRSVNINEGWYNQSTGAGIYSTAPNHLETYNNSAFKVNGLLTAAAGLKIGDITIQSDGANGVEFRNSSNVLLMVLNANGEIKTKGNHYFNQAL